MQKNILLYVPTLEGGGAEKVFIQLATYFINNGYDVWLITAYGNAYKNIQHKSLKILRVFPKKPSKNKSLNSILRLIVMPVFLAIHIVKIKPLYFLTAVLEANILGNIAHFLSFSKSKFVIRQAGELENETHPGSLAMFLKWAFNRSSLIIANSEGTKSTILNFYKNIIFKVKVIGNPIYEEKELIENRSSKESFLLAVGRLEPQKDYPTMLKAFSMVSNSFDINLKIAGDGSLREDFKSLTKHLEIEEKVHFLGFKEDLDTYYSNCTALILSSHNEAFGNVIVEAMAFGKPIISTKCAGPKDIINNKHLGELCEIKNPKELSKAISKVIQHPENYPSNEIISRAKDFSVEVIGDKYLKALRNIDI